MAQEFSIYLPWATGRPILNLRTLLWQVGELYSSGLCHYIWCFHATTEYLCIPATPGFPHTDFLWGKPDSGTHCNPSNGIFTWPTLAQLCHFLSKRWIYFFPHEVQGARWLSRPIESGKIFSTFWMLRHLKQFLTLYWPPTIKFFVLLLHYCILLLLWMGMYISVFLLVLGNPCDKIIWLPKELWPTSWEPLF